MIKLLALDPGATTGVCIATIEGQDVLLEPSEGRISPLGLYNILETLTALYDFDTSVAVIYEDFQFRQGVRTGLDLTPARLIGIIELWEERCASAIGFYCQQPSVQGAKAYWSDARLKELGVYWAHGKGHARSATKHMLHWIKFGAGAQYVKDPQYKIAGT